MTANAIDAAPLLQSAINHLQAAIAHGQNNREGDMSASVANAMTRIGAAAHVLGVVPIPPK
jgi:hypothetical protein